MSPFLAVSAFFTQRILNVILLCLVLVEIDVTMPGLLWLLLLSAFCLVALAHSK